MNTRSEPRARQVARLTPGAKQLRHEVVTWAMAAGRPLSFDALTVVLGTKSEVPIPLRRWTEDDVWRLWWLDLAEWCGRHGVAPPAGLASALLAVVAHLDATGTLHPGSDSLDDLVLAQEAAGADDYQAHPASA